MGNQIGEIWSDLDPRIVQDSQGNLKKVINLEAVLGSIDNILGTSKGERVMLPLFGSNLKHMLFEGINETLMKFISRELQESIETWDNRVKVLEIGISTDPDSSSISIFVNFVIKGYGEIFEYATEIKGGY